MINFKLFRHQNFLASNLSQLLAGMIELGLGFLTPFFLLLVVGVSPTTAGIALIPATIPVILAGPLAGKAFDRFGGRWPLVGGFLVLAASGIVLAVSVSSESAVALIPGLLLQGLGLGIVLTVNDPTGLTAVPDKDSGEAAGMINTSEQLGGALGIAILEAIELGINFAKLQDHFDERGIHPTPHQNEVGRNLILEAEQKGLDQRRPQPDPRTDQARRDRLPHHRLRSDLPRLLRHRPARRAGHLRPRPQERPAEDPGAGSLQPSLPLDRDERRPLARDQSPTGAAAWGIGDG